MENKTAPIYVVVSDGSVQEIKNIPAEARVQVIDKDEEFVESERWEISPVDGEACTGKTLQRPWETIEISSNGEGPSARR